MNSFSKNSKIEIINQQIEPVNCGVPFLFGLFVSSANYSEEKNIEVSTDIKDLHPFIFKNIKNIIKNYQKIQEKYQKNTKNSVFFDNLIKNNHLEEYIFLKNNFKINERMFYKIVFKYPILSELFSLFGIEEKLSLLDNINCFSNNFESLKAFIKGVYIGCATSSIKISDKPNEKTSSGYHLEFTSKNIILLREISHLIAQFDISAKLISRKNNYVLYIKDSENVSDLLALVGANNSVVTLQNEIVKREFRNKINRQTNCLSGNISKTVEASLKQLEAIDKIDKEMGLENLPPDLEEIALMRLANPEEPLNNLLKLSRLNLTNSGVKHRVKRLISIADNFKK